jgi:hypothetical protein
VRHDLADHEPVEEVTYGGQVLLDGRRRQRLCLQLDPGGHVQRLHSSNRRHTRLRAPGEKLTNGVRYARRLCELRIDDAKNTGKRTPARSPAETTSAGMPTPAGRARSVRTMQQFRELLLRMGPGRRNEDSTVQFSTWMSASRAYPIRNTLVPISRVAVSVRSLISYFS